MNLFSWFPLPLCQVAKPAANQTFLDFKLLISCICQSRRDKLSCDKCLCVSLWKHCSPSLFAAIWGRAACSKWLLRVLLCSSLLKSCLQTCALLLEWWVEHQKSYQNTCEEGKWLIWLPQGDISSVPNLSPLHLSWEQMTAPVSSSKRKRKSCSTTIPIKCCDSCHLLAGGEPSPQDRTNGRESPIYSVTSRITVDISFVMLGRWLSVPFFIQESFQSS